MSVEEKPEVKNRKVQTSKPETEGEVSDVPKKTYDIVDGSDGSLFTDLRKIEAVVGPILLTLVAAFIRLYKIGLSKRVVWDEAHFGKFGSFYLNHTYYFDVHPPLGKMLCGLSGHLAGYNGSFDFTSGQDYPESMNYTFMRAFNCLFSIVCVPVAYFTAKSFKFSLLGVWLISTMVCFEQSFIVLGRFILLDSMLICFTTTAFLGLAKFHEHRKQPFSAKWFLWLFITGASLGLTTGVKMVGLFITALVGLYTACDLWIRLGDRKQSLAKQALHLIVRAIFLIIVPLILFAIAYKIHFQVLWKTGDGASMMSSLFRAQLAGETIENSPLDVAYGARITLKNSGLGGNLLHSHVQTFPSGSEQQQITTYGHADSNNEWLIETPRPAELYNESQPIEYVKDGDMVRLIHAVTGRNLHTHEINAPVTKGSFEVSGYGNLTVGDNKDNWIVEIVESLGDEDPNLIHPLSTAIRLRNEVLGCYLSTGANNLPEWGFRQGEVVCLPNASKRNKQTWWNVEQHWNERLPIAENRKYPKTQFFRDFITLWVSQMRSNNALITDNDRTDNLASSWWEWPIVYRGLRMCGWGNDYPRYLLLGTPTTLWLTTVAVLVFPFVCLAYILRWQRQCNDFTPQSFEFFMTVGVLSWLGWLFQYVPFIIMARVTYLHHYMPALYFAIFVFTFLLQWFVPKRYQAAVFLTFIAITIACWWHFRMLSWGMEGEPSDYNYLRWMERWRVGDDFPLKDRPESETIEAVTQTIGEVVEGVAENVADAVENVMTTVLREGEPVPSGFAEQIVNAAENIAAE
ncbi:dolichyl-phosphate-mannose-protein mannosyltransferase [Starmerella bacillaris]|uniref:Dolichyl-phosphate-mannose--protein mannosyltransferase n=1 Tax=Starmerella bacillaris TaxID=1247836 RepID=A0AAV5RFB2_STABA|nr:dolichyl-phosphate-mannose-protein mannosyltransferase [Starmerella bacillaris]